MGFEGVDPEIWQFLQTSEWNYKFIAGILQSLEHTYGRYGPKVSWYGIRYQISPLTKPATNGLEGVDAKIWQFLQISDWKYKFIVYIWQSL
jgi:hypothetical protein